MRALKKVGLALATVFGAVCAVVLICAFNPGITEKISGLLAGTSDIQDVESEKEQEKDQGELDYLGPYASLNPIVSKEPALIEEGYDKHGIANLLDEEDRYVFPTVDLEIPERLLGRNGRIPTEELPGFTKDLCLEEGYTGQEYDFDPFFYPYYGMLSEALQNVYKQVYANAMKLNPVFVPVEALTAQQIQYVVEAVYYDHPELFWMDPGYDSKYDNRGICVELMLDFNYMANSLEDYKTQFTHVANEIVQGAVNYTEDWEKERYVHDALLGRVEYQLAAQVNQSAYSALVNRETVCAGYARAFQYVLHQLQIPCYYVTGYAGQNHAWNMVYLSGAFYNVDVTWDDTAPSSYYYFNKSDELFGQSHVRQSLSVNLPACQGKDKWAYLEKESPNKWQNTTGNMTDQSGETYLPDYWFDEYDGTVITSLEDYYNNCYVQIMKGEGDGSVVFANVIDGETLEELYAAYNKSLYIQGYLDKALKANGLNHGKVTIRITVFEAEKDAEKEDADDKDTDDKENTDKEDSSDKNQATDKNQTDDKETSSEEQTKEDSSDKEDASKEDTEEQEDEWEGWYDEDGNLIIDEDHILKDKNYLLEHVVKMW